MVAVIEITIVHFLLARTRVLSFVKRKFHNTGMSWQILKQRITYHYKKYLAIATSAIALVLMLTNFGFELAYEVVNSPSDVVTIVLSLWNLVVYLIAYFLILLGNIQGSYNAYNGMLAYIFMFIFDAARALFFSSGIGVSTWASGSVLLIFIGVLYFLFTVLALTSGIMTYIRTRQYIVSHYTSYRGVRNWCLAFMICSLLMNVSGPVLEAIEGVFPWYYPPLYLLPISEAFISVSIYFTVLRLKSEY